jgi:hypothetical protein
MSISGKGAVIFTLSFIQCFVRAYGAFTFHTVANEIHRGLCGLQQFPTFYAGAQATTSFVKYTTSRQRAGKRPVVMTTRHVATSICMPRHSYPRPTSKLSATACAPAVWNDHVLSPKADQSESRARTILRQIEVLNANQIILAGRRLRPGIFLCSNHCPSSNPPHLNSTPTSFSKYHVVRACPPDAPPPRPPEQARRAHMCRELEAQLRLMPLTRPSGYCFVLSGVQVQGERRGPTPSWSGAGFESRWIVGGG